MADGSVSPPALRSWPPQSVAQEEFIAKKKHLRQRRSCRSRAPQPPRLALPASNSSWEGGDVDQDWEEDEEEQAAAAANGARACMPLAAHSQWVSPVCGCRCERDAFAAAQRSLPPPLAMSHLTRAPSSCLALRAQLAALAHAPCRLMRPAGRPGARPAPFLQEQPALRRRRLPLPRRYRPGRRAVPAAQQGPHALVSGQDFFPAAER